MFIAANKNTSSSPIPIGMAIVNRNFPLGFQHSMAGIILSLVYLILPFKPQESTDKEQMRVRNTMRYILIIATMIVGLGAGSIPLFLTYSLPWNPNDVSAEILSASMIGPYGMFCQCLLLVLGAISVLYGQSIHSRKIDYDSDEAYKF